MMSKIFSLKTLVKKNPDDLVKMNLLKRCDKPFGNCTTALKTVFFCETHILGALM